jgi:exodeoxyribonuclease-5
MTSLSNDQLSALSVIQDWTADSYAKQVLKVYGYAGTGKTTLIKHLLETGPAVPVMAFTGKAASVLNDKGVPATTIHSAIYKPLPENKDKVARLNEKIEEAERKLSKLSDPKERRLLVRLIRSYHDALKDVFAPSFVLNEESPIRDAPLIICDEVSMVGAELCEDLLSFGTRVLVFGDPGQLPPIKSEESALSTGEPDVMLTEIMRQEAGNPIIAQSIRVRNGEDIQPGGTIEVRRKYGDLHAFDQLITGKNETRRFINDEFREELKLDFFPSGKPEERLIGLTNSSALGLYNGQFISMRNVKVDEDKKVRTFKANIHSENGDFHGKAEVWKGHFEDCHRYNPQRYTNDKRRWQFGDYEADWAYCLTVHKAQGSQWDHVGLIDDGIMIRDKEFRKRWLYTALTRAAERFTLIKSGR